MSRPKSDKPTRVRIGLRVPAELLAQAEAWHRERREHLALMGVDRWTMTDTICHLLAVGLRTSRAPRL